MTTTSTPAPAPPPSPLRVDVSKYASHFSWKNRLGRVAWSLVYHTLFRWSPTPFFGWRRFLLRVFGATLARHAVVYPDTRIWAPWNLEMGEFACLGPEVNCYCVDRITLGAHATVSQFAHLCGAGHDITDPAMGLIHAPIHIGPGAWVCAGAFVSPGLTLGEGAVVAAMGCVTKDVPPWEVWGGNPAHFIKPRKLESAQP